MKPRIIATGSCVPERIVTNDDLAKIMDTSDEWIRTRTGIRARRISEAAPEEKLLSLMQGASEAAIRMAEERLGAVPEIDLIIAATCTPDMAFPATACRLAGRLRADGATAFDLSLACTGFLAALDTASAFLSSGRCKTALVVGGDVMSRMIDWSDRSTAVLFGDGAGAVILQSAEDPEPDPLPQFVLHADGTRADALFCRAMYFNEAERASEHMDGRRVFEFAVRSVPEVIAETLERAGAKQEEVSLYVLHQANYRIIEAVAKRMKEPIEKFSHNIERYGNTTAGSIPILLDELNRSGSLKPGALICLSGFGAGLSYGAALIRWA